MTNLGSFSPASPRLYQIYKGLVSSIFKIQQQQQQPLFLRSKVSRTQSAAAVERWQLRITVEPVKGCTTQLHGNNNIFTCDAKIGGFNCVRISGVVQKNRWIRSVSKKKKNLGQIWAFLSGEHSLMFVFVMMVCLNRTKKWCFYFD